VKFQHLRSKRKEPCHILRPNPSFEIWSWRENEETLITTSERRRATKNYRKQKLQELKRDPDISSRPLTNVCVHREGYNNFLKSQQEYRKRSADCSGEDG